MSMPMRFSLVAALFAAAAAVPAPALAREGDPAMTEKLTDPRTQIAVAAVLAGIGEALLDLHIGPFARAAEAAGGSGAVRDLPADARLRDIAGPDAERLPGELARRVPRVMGTMGSVADAIADMVPAVEQMGARVREALPPSE